MSVEDYREFIHLTNYEQKAVLLHCIYGIVTPSCKLMQVFFTKPVGYGQTFTYSLLMETYNMLCQEPGCLDNAYVGCAMTGKAAVAVAGDTLHLTLNVTLHEDYGDFCSDT